MRMRSWLGLTMCVVLALAVSPAVRAQEAPAPAPAPGPGGEVTLVQDGQARAVIYAPADVMKEEDVETRGMPEPNAEAERQRQRLRASVGDLALYLERMSGAKVEVVTDAPAANEGRTVILIGEPARQAFGAPEKTLAYRQGLRIVVAPGNGEGGGRVGLIGESDLATSYAIYTVLDRLGCRWYMPSEMGEVIPQQATITLPAGDESLAPATVYRTIWYADDDYKRRNRMGGLALQAGHALEITGVYLTQEDKQAHPEWLADVKGLKNDHRLKWSNAELAAFIADKIIGMHDANPQPSYSLSPDDGATWDDSPEDRALDAGDWDPTFGQVSLTDRYLVLVNRIAERVAAKHPDVLLGFLAYVQYTRPPVREKVHPNLVPQVAPITYSRAHPMSMDEVPDNTDLRYIVEGWAKAAKQTSWYFYAFYLAETSAPFPMLAKWGFDVPYVLREGNCAFWQPETMPNFEYAMHALYMANRLAWDPSLEPEQVYDEINQRFYGSAGDQMAAYWDHIDRCWVETDEYSGCGFGYLRRFTPERMAEARELMDAALAAAQTEQEKFRIGMADESLRLLERFIELRRDLAEGRFEQMEQKAEEWRQLSTSLGEKYQAQSAFTRTHWAPQTVNVTYFNAFYGATYRDATRVAAEGRILTDSPLREWKYQPDSDPEARPAPAQEGQAKPERDVSTDPRVQADFDDGQWETTDVAVETWSTLGLHGYMGSMWYRKQVEVPQVEQGRKTYLWIGSTDGSVEVFVNGQRVPYLKPVLGEDNQPTGQFERQPKADGYCQPFTFDITEAVRPGQENTIAIFATRGFVNELGTGGLLSPAVIYTDK